jgi:hypothetical protein
MRHIQNLGIFRFINENISFTYKVDKNQNKKVFALKKMSNFTKQECYYLLLPRSDTVKQFIDSGYKFDSVNEYIRLNLAPSLHIYNLE